MHTMSSMPYGIMRCTTLHYYIYMALSHNQTGIGVSVYIKIGTQVVFVSPTIELRLLSTLPLIHSFIHSCASDHYADHNLCQRNKQPQY